MTGARVFIQRIRRDGNIIEATADTVLQAGDIVAVAGPREVLVDVLGQRGPGGRRPRIAECAGRRC